MRQGKALLFLITASALLSFSCGRTGGKHLEQGEIHYSVQYEGQVTKMPKELMPKNLIVSFKDNNIVYELISPVGNSGITNLSNPSKEIFDTYLSLFTIRYYYPSKPGEIYPGFEAMHGIEIKKTSKSAVICGLNCKSAEVTFPSDRLKVYEVWYTEEIPIKNPNASTPFFEIDGVLMSFFFFIGRSEFRFEAQNVYKKEIPDKTFERKEKYKEVSRKDINKFINKMISL
ncbi:MAG: hypothetical protein RBT38_00440 [Bacteroidales bacterium]|nr:hypothetical protein [Bacteroidales bacterium]